VQPTWEPGLLALYTENSIVVPEPGTHVRGLAGIEAAINQFLNAQPASVSIAPSAVVINGDTSISYSPWTASVTGPDGEIPLEGIATVVMQRTADGWETVIDDFFSKG
jgi:ketosteroid isomerase-like protein